MQIATSKDIKLIIFENLRGVKMNFHRNLYFSIKEFEKVQTT